MTDKISITLTDKEMEQFLSMKRDLEEADRINGEAINRQVELEKTVESLSAKLAKVRKAMESAAGVVDELRDALGSTDSGETKP